jgi:hypothetical protein
MDGTKRRRKKSPPLPELTPAQVWSAIDMLHAKMPGTFALDSMSGS